MDYNFLDPTGELRKAIRFWVKEELSYQPKIQIARVESRIDKLLISVKSLYSDQIFKGYVLQSAFQNIPILKDDLVLCVPTELLSQSIMEQPLKDLESIPSPNLSSFYLFPLTTQYNLNIEDLEKLTLQNKTGSVIMSFGESEINIKADDVVLETTLSGALEKIGGKTHKHTSTDSLGVSLNTSDAQEIGSPPLPTP